MTRRLCTLLLVAALVGVACDRGRSSPPGLEGTEPLLAEFARVAKGLDDIGPDVAAWNGQGGAPGGLIADMREVGEAAQAVVLAAEPDGKAGGAALSAAVADAADDVVRHLVIANGGREGLGQMALDSAAAVAFDIDVNDSPTDPSPDEPSVQGRRELRKIEAQERLRGDLHGEIRRFVYVVLLAYPATRFALAPRLSPDDLPAEVPGNLNLPVTNRQEWRQNLFDDQNHLVVPGPSDPVRWRSFLGWIKTVNPDFGFVAESLADEATQFVTGK